ncbi:hypothetical protein TetV_305 [Tetraselmis virus 1]|uniref:Uncharacterized protein n=1 Tax=Tetraselmis virus 1 TaxID=2060617 RepID=A0A2P0VNA8_9VIRU|nr:hypothetical protein QJ968_gp305 [Tetraselmis virus 1]AUF82397.1 hypothetical protein TetV_305 [Tetraselmis virus 1]
MFVHSLSQVLAPLPDTSVIIKKYEKAIVKCRVAPDLRHRIDRDYKCKRAISDLRKEIKTFHDNEKN